MSREDIVDQFVSEATQRRLWNGSMLLSPSRMRDYSRNALRQIRIQAEYNTSFIKEVEADIILLHKTGV